MGIEDTPLGVINQAAVRPEGEPPLPDPEQTEKKTEQVEKKTEPQPKKHFGRK